MVSRCHTGLAVSALVAIMARIAFAQLSPPSIGSLTLPPDARLVAMGESFVAVPGNLSAMMSNPAGLAGLRGVWLLYAHRGHPDREAGYWHALGSVALPFGTIGVVYDRSTFGAIPVTDATHPEGTGEVLEEHDEFLGIGIGHSFSENWSAGISVKRYDSTPLFGETLSRPYLVDFGILLSIPGVFADSIGTDLLAVGVSAQNMGSDFRIRVVQTLPYWSQVYDYTWPLPRYVRLGLSYQYTLPPQAGRPLSPIVLLFTAEYRALFSPLTDTPGDGKPGRDFWGIGAEGTVYDLLSARVGCFVQPFTGVYADRDKPVIRFGAGVKIPLERIGIEVPLTLCGDYSAIPVPSYSVSMLHSFSVSAQYGVSLP
jgi:hypothetical protein